MGQGGGYQTRELFDVRENREPRSGLCGKKAPGIAIPSSARKAWLKGKSQDLSACRNAASISGPITSAARPPMYSPRAR